MDVLKKGQRGYGAQPSFVIEASSPGMRTILICGAVLLVTGVDCVFCA